MIYLIYVILAVLVVLCSTKLSAYVDALDKKTNLSGAFLGGVLLAAGTSLPELFTSLTAVLSLDEPQLVQGNVLGSNIFNLCIPAVLVLSFNKRYRQSRIAQSHYNTLYFGLAMYVCCALAIVSPFSVSLGFTQVNLMTPVIIVLYVIGIRLMKNDDSVEQEEESDLDLSIRQIMVRFVLFSLALVAVSIALTQVTDQIADALQLGTTVAGAIFLGVATSLPVLSASVSLVRLNNFNASIGNVVGSNLFNFTILCFADLLYQKACIYILDGATLFASQVGNLLLFGLLSSIIMIVVLAARKSKAAVQIAAVLILASYVASIMLSM